MNKLLPKVGQYVFMAEPFHCDFLGCLSMGHLGNSMLNAADFHSDERGYGMSVLLPEGKTWVLSRLVIDMTTFPKAYDKFYIETWVDGLLKCFTTRNFSVLNKNKQPVGYGKSIWALIDTKDRKPCDLMLVGNGTIGDYVETEKECPINKPSHVKIGKDAELIAKHITAYSDIDMNGHVNSVKYIEHVLNLWETTFYTKNTIKRLEVAYMAESYFGDILCFYREDMGEGIYHIRITKQSSNDETEIDVCRIAVTFGSCK